MVALARHTPAMDVMFGESKSILISELPSLLREEFPDNQMNVEPTAIIGIGTK